MYYVYVLVEKQTGQTYVGFSTDLKARVAQHQEGRGAKATMTGSWHLVYYEAYACKVDAMLRERRIKHNGNARRQLMARIEKSIDWVRSGAGEARNRSPGKRRP